MAFKNVPFCSPAHSPSPRALLPWDGQAWGKRPATAKLIDPDLSGTGYATAHYGKWKLLLNPGRGRAELYDIMADPRERDNLAGRHPDVVDALSGRALAWRSTLPEAPTDPDAGPDT